MRALILLVLVSGCAGGGICMQGSAVSATPTTFARGADVTLAITWPAGAFVQAPESDAFAGELLGPGGVLVGFIGGGGPVVSFTVSSATSATLVLNIPTSRPAGTYSLGVVYRGSACMDATAPMLTFTVT